MRFSMRDRSAHRYGHDAELMVVSSSVPIEILKLLGLFAIQIPASMSLRLSPILLSDAGSHALRPLLPFLSLTNAKVAEVFSNFTIATISTFVCLFRL